ncbi:MAG: ROK family transcriptional regulator [Chloroflexi bacterium]|nr:ROK family transcriptional regulator [Chloroflexota bacterium]
MPYPYTITASDMRRINRSAVLDLIRREAPISRTEIADRLDVSLPTVMRIVDELIEQELVLPHPDTEFSGGRPRSLLSFNSAANVVIGIDLGGTKLFGAVADLSGHILHEVAVEQHETTGDASYRQLVGLIEDLLASCRDDGHTIRGIGVGAPGVTLHQEGIVTWAPSLNWRDYPLRARLVDDFKLPVIVDNDVNLAVLGELWFGVDDEVQNLVLITIGTGIGAGIVIDGSLYRGAHEASGEVGYFLLGREFLGKRYDGFGAFESLASGTGIAERARQARNGQPDGSSLSAEQVFDAMRDGDAWAREVVEETLDYLAMAIANVSVLLDPEIIILGGGVANSADLIIEPVLRRLDGAIPVAPKLAVSRLGRKAVVMGTIASVLHHTVDYYVVRRPS